MLGQVAGSRAVEQEMNLGSRRTGKIQIFEGQWSESCEGAEEGTRGYLWTRVPRG